MERNRGREIGEGYWGRRVEKGNIEERRSRGGGPRECESVQVIPHGIWKISRRPNKPLDHPWSGSFLLKVVWLTISIVCLRPQGYLSLRLPSLRRIRQCS
jgi:hypothetical protein